MDERYEDIVDHCIQQILAGASPDAVAGAYPEHRAELLGVLAPLASLVAARLDPPAPAARTAALQRMLAGVNAAASPAPRGFLSGAFSSLFARPVASRLASGAAAVVLFAGASIGASAATGRGPAAGWPIIGGAGNGPESTQVRGAVSSSSDGSIVLISEGTQFDVLFSAQTKFSRDGEQIEAVDLKLGDVVHVRGKVGRDRVVEAEDVEAELPDDDAPPVGATPEHTPSAGSGSDDVGGNDSGDDDGADEDSPTAESGGSDEGPGGGSGDDGHGDKATPERAEPTSESSDHGSGSGTPTVTPDSEDKPETKTPEPED